MPNRWASTAAGLLFVAVLTGCTGSGSPGSTPVEGPHIAVPLQLADCTGGPTGSPGLRGNVLDDERAYRLFQNYCGNYFARGFKLYKLYTRAAAFSPPKR